MQAPQRRVLILYTGGTIGMQQTPQGYAPVPGWLEGQLRSMPQFQDPDQPPGTTPPSRFGQRVSWNLLEFSPLLDSSNIGVHDWRRIAEAIRDHYDGFDAFIVLHGTDTMSYTASALSFMLADLGKTVVLTGSQIPLGHVRNDAVENLLGALTLAGHYDIPEVGLYFRGKLFRGNRTQKVDAAGLEAFDAGNLGPLATIGVNVSVDWSRVRPGPRRQLRYLPITAEDVLALRLYPGLSGETLRHLFRLPVRGVVLETYGAGNAPDNRPDFLDALREATGRGVVVVNVTQCHKGGVKSDYAAGRTLLDAGVVPGADLTAEAALTKLAWLLSREELTVAEVRRKLTVDLRGELTAERPDQRFSFREREFVDVVARTLARAGSAEGRDAVERALYPVLLSAAAAQGDVEGLRRMLAAGARPDDTDPDRRSALHVACAEGQLEPCRTLVLAGAPLDLTDREGRTPLMEAARFGHADIVSLLLAAGADRTRTDRDGRSALDQADPSVQGLLG